MNTRKALTPRMIRFTQEYPIDLIGRSAAIRAGFPELSAAAQACRMLQDPRIQALIKEQLDDRARRVGMTADSTLRALGRQMNVDPRKLVDADGTPRRLIDLDDDTAAALSSFDLTELRPGHWVINKAKFSDRNASIALAMRHFGMLNDKLEVTAKPSKGLDEFYGQVASSAEDASADTGGDELFDDE